MQPDKKLHFIVSAAICIILYILFQFKMNFIDSLCASAVFTFFIGFFKEYIYDKTVPGHDCDLKDLLADVLGIFAGIVASIVISLIF